MGPATAAANTPNMISHCVIPFMEGGGAERIPHLNEAMMSEDVTHMPHTFSHTCGRKRTRWQEALALPLESAFACVKQRGVDC